MSDGPASAGPPASNGPASTGQPVGEQPAPSDLSAPLLMVGASLLFAGMGVCVKFASDSHSAGEIVFYRGLIGALVIGLMSRWQGGTLATTMPAAHFWRSVSGVTALCLWFYAIGGLPLATAITLNYMSSVWLALFLVGGAVVMGSARVDAGLVVAVLTGFAGVALVLQPTIADEQIWPGLAGLMSGVLSALVYLQLTALGRSGEPDYRVVFYFSIGGIVAGAALAQLGGGLQALSWRSAGLLLAIGLLAVFAQIMMTRAYTIGATLSNAGLQYLGILFGWVFGVLLLDEAITAGAVAGIVLIVGAGLASTWLGRERLSRNNPVSDS